MPKVLDPVADFERHFSGDVFGSLWVTWGLSLYAVIVGVRLTAPSAMGGHGLSLTQTIFVALFSLLLIGLLVGAVSRAAFDSGLATGMLLKPSFGIAGSWIVSAVVAVAYVIWMALELRVAARFISAAVDSAGMDVPAQLGVVASALAVGGVSYLGLQRFASRLVRPVLVWVAAALVLVTLLDLSQRDLTFVRATADFGSMVRAAQEVVLYAMVFLPLVADTSRFAQRSEYAVRSTGVGFVGAMAVAMLAGALLGAVGTAPTTDALAEALLASGTAAVGMVALAWVIAGELPQPYGFLYGAANSGSAILLRRPPLLLGWLLVVVAAAGAVFLRAPDLTSAAELLAFLLAPAFAIVLVDFYLVRRTHYVVDEMYARTGEYGGVNYVGVSAYLVGLIAGYVADPVGPEVLLRGVEAAVPFAGAWRSFAPALLVAMAVAGTIYFAVGRWRLPEDDVVSHVRL